MAELHQFITVFAAILSVVRQRFFGEALRETHGTHLDQRKIVIENAMAPFHLRASLCKILISSFAHKMDFAHNFSVDFFNKYITNMKPDWRNSLL